MLTKLRAYCWLLFFGARRFGIIHVLFRPKVSTHYLHRRKRNDAGPTDQLGPPEWFVKLDGEYYPVSWIKSAPGLSDLEVSD